MRRRALFSAGAIDKATEQLAAASKVEARSYEVLMLSGRILEREHREAETLAAYEKAAESNAANPRARTQIVAVATQTGRWEVAERHLRVLLEMGYQPSRTHFGLGRVAQIQGKSAEAAGHYREALRLEPGLPMAVEGLRSLGVSSGRLSHGSSCGVAYPIHERARTSRDTQSERAAVS